MQTQGLPTHLLPSVQTLNVGLVATHRTGNQLPTLTVVVINGGHLQTHSGIHVS
jgi:hypothetical protein